MTLLPRATASACVLLFFPILPAAAAPADTALLRSYAGTYTGSGAITGDTRPQTVRCRLNMQSTAPAKLDYAGRCSAGGVSFSMTGIISYDGSGFTAAMASSTGTTATVKGRKAGDGVVFTSTQDVTIQGRTRNVTSAMALTGGTIRVDYRTVDGRTGKITTGSIPFVKATR